MKQSASFACLAAWWLLCSISISGHSPRSSNSVSYGPVGVSAFQPSRISNRAPCTQLPSFSVSVDEIEKDLTPGERSVTGVVRKCGASVAFVTSVLPTPSFSTNRRTSRQQSGGGKNSKKKENGLPQGQSLGSGSGFLTTPGYVCTNYHVIERAYTMQQTGKQAMQFGHDLIGNITESTASWSLLPSNINQTLTDAFRNLVNQTSLPMVYVRINSDTSYLSCRIVDVEPDLDLAVLRVEQRAGDNDGNDDSESSSPSTNSDTWNTVSFGSSSDLLVGQSVVAIGNPFGLDKTVTTGVVSALNRELKTGDQNAVAPTKTIRNCIQTDAAINPGNSGGPLLNLNGDVVGINTAIITTSGSNAGIGFAVPSDQLSPVVQQIVRKDQIERDDQKRGWLGVQIAMNNATAAPLRIAKVSRNSPAQKAEIFGMRVDEYGILKGGDALVAINGNAVVTFEDFQKQMDQCMVKEQITLTVEDLINKERRVVYATLEERPGL